VVELHLYCIFEQEFKWITWCKGYKKNLWRKPWILLNSQSDYWRVKVSICIGIGFLLSTYWKYYEIINQEMNCVYPLSQLRTYCWTGNGINDSFERNVAINNNFSWRMACIKTCLRTPFCIRTLSRAVLPLPFYLVSEKRVSENFYWYKLLS